MNFMHKLLIIHKLKVHNCKKLWTWFPLSHAA